MDRFIVEPLQHVIDRLQGFLPHLIMALVVLLLGLVAGWLTKVIFRSIFGLLKLDTHAERSGVGSLLAKGGLKDSPSLLLARLAGSMVVFAFFLIALSNLNLKVLDQLIERIFGYLPNIFVAIIISILGFLLGNFFGRATLIAAVNAGLQFPRLVSRCIRILIFTLAALVALEHLGIGKETILLAFAILFSGIVLALAIAFGLGGKGLAKEFLEKKLRANSREGDINHL